MWVRTDPPLSFSRLELDAHSFALYVSILGLPDGSGLADTPGRTSVRSLQATASFRSPRAFFPNGHSLPKPGRSHHEVSLTTLSIMRRGDP